VNTCATCRHFGMQDERGSDFHVCERILHCDSYNAPPRGHRAFTNDADNCSSCLMVRPDFGCVEWAQSTVSAPKQSTEV